MKNLLRTAAPALLILLFAYAAISKLADFPKFRHEMNNQNFPPEVAEALLYLVPAAELAAVILLLTEKGQKAGLILSAALMALFTGYIGLVLTGYWQRVPCSCGGVLRNMSWQAHFFFNLFFLALSAAALYPHLKTSKTY
jgi:putative oxidoreductase